MPNGGAAPVAAVAAVVVATVVTPAMRPTRAAAQTGDAAARLVVTRITTAVDGGPSNGNSYDPELSSDGRFVVFASTATNLVAYDAPGHERTRLFVHDRLVNATIRVDQDPCHPRQPSISDDGLTIAFSAGECSSPWPGYESTTGPTQVYVHDRRTGGTRVVSLDAHGTRGERNSDAARVTSDGRRVLFRSEADLTRCCGAYRSRVYSHDLDSGRTTLESVLPTGEPAESHEGLESHRPMSRDGRLVVFRRYAYDPAPRGEVYVRDRLRAVTTHEGTTGPLDAGQPLPALVTTLSGDGRFLLWWLQFYGSRAAFTRVFIRDRLAQQTRIAGDSPFDFQLNRVEASDDLAVAVLLGQSLSGHQHAYVLDTRTNRRFETPATVRISGVAGRTVALQRDGGRRGGFDIDVATLVPASDAPSLTAEVQGSRVTLRWTPQAVGPPPVSYRLEAGSTPGGRDVFVGDLGPVTALATDAAPGSYYVRVIGVTAAGDTAPSNELLIRIMG